MCVFRMCMNCYESDLLDGWMKENACKIFDSHESHDTLYLCNLMITNESK